MYRVRVSAVSVVVTGRTDYGGWRRRSDETASSRRFDHGGIVSALMCLR
jgi:hypothetical protein